MLAGETVPIIWLPWENPELALSISCAGKRRAAMGRVCAPGLGRSQWHTLPGNRPSARTAPVPLSPGCHPAMALFPLDVTLPWPPSPWMSPYPGHLPPGYYLFLLISAWAAQPTALHEGRVVSPHSSSQVLGAGQDMALGCGRSGNSCSLSQHPPGTATQEPHLPLPLHRAASGHEPRSPVSHVSPLCPMPAHPQSAVLSISSSQFPVAHQELQSSSPVQGNKTPKSWRKGLEGQAGMPRPFPGFHSMDKGTRVCLSIEIMGLPRHVAMDGTQSHVLVPLGRQSLSVGEGCNEEIGVNLIN